MGAMIKQKEELKEQCHMVHIFSAHNKISEIARCLKYSLKVLYSTKLCIFLPVASLVRRYIRGPPIQNFRRPLLVEVRNARVERRICTSLGGPGLTGKIFKSRLSEMPFPGLWGEILANVFQSTA